MTTFSGLLDALISALNSHYGLKAILESLHLWLIHNTKEFSSRKTVEGVACNLNLEDAICISDTIFEELSKRLYVPFDNSSTTQSPGQETLQSESDAAEEEIIMLLRCCIASLKLLENDQHLLVGRCDFLNRIVCVLSSCQNNDNSPGSKTFFHTNLDIHSRLVSRMLEVFMDELITNKLLSKYIKNSASFSSAVENICHCVDSGYVLKVASAHFLQCFSRVQSFEGSVENLIWTLEGNRSTPEVSLTAAVSLLINPALASPPAFLHAHLISLISDVIGRNAVYDHVGFSLRSIDCYMPAFERSVGLYHRRLLKLVPNILSEYDDSIIRSAIPGVGRQQPFESYVCTTMNARLNSVIHQIDCSSCAALSQTKSNMFMILNNYVKENLHLLDESRRSIASLFFSFFVTNSVSAESGDALVRKNVTVIPEDAYLLASILKLMSCSLLQTVMYISRVRNSVHHEMLVHIINSFGEYWIQLPLKELLHDKLEAEFSSFSSLNGSRLMFVHFTGLLSMSLTVGIEILAKGCLYMLLNLMNLLIFEDGNLNFLSQLVGSQTEFELFQHPRTKASTLFTTDVDSSSRMQEADKKRRSSVALASEFRKIQMTRTRKRSASEFQDEEAEDTVVEDETCNGLTFLKCLKSSGASAVCLDEDIVDFISCKQGKDYSAWLKNRAKYRTRKLQKVTDQSKEIKKAARISLRRKR